MRFGKCQRCVILSFALLVGCQGRSDMVGQVKLGEKPLVFGTVLALGSDNIPKQAPIAQDGSYRVKDLPTGDVRVAVTSVDPKSIGRNLIRRKGVDPKLQEGFDHIVGWFPIPSTYNDIATSGLKYTLHRGENSVDILLK